MKAVVQPSDLIELFAQNVKARRVELGLTQEQLAERLGCHVPYVSNLENGKKTPWLKNLATIAEALETTPDALIAPLGSRRKKTSARS